MKLKQRKLHIRPMCGRKKEFQFLGIVGLWYCCFCVDGDYHHDYNGIGIFTSSGGERVLLLAKTSHNNRKD
jgi:hypothetical protein